MQMRTIAAVVLLLSVALFSSGCPGRSRPIKLPWYELPPDWPYFGHRGEMLVPWEGHYRYYFPHIEEALLPLGVTEGEASTIELRISAEYRAVILQGYTANEFHGVFFAEHQDNPALAEGEFAIMPPYPAPDNLVGADYDYELNLTLAVWEPPGAGEPVESFVYHLPPLPAGKYLVRVFAALERQWGGIGWYSYDLGNMSGRIEGDPVSWLNYLGDTEYSFEIQPEEEQG